jgi:hypothetical protein
MPDRARAQTVAAATGDETTPLERGTVMTTTTSLLTRILTSDLGIDAGYRHAPKRVTPGEPIETRGALLKWYDLHRDDQPVPAEVNRLARACLLAGPLAATGLGFVVLHRCGEGFYFLIVCTWRNSNEFWQTVFYKDGDAMAEFAPFPREGEHKPTLCVWELVPVWHERQAWERFLATSRDESAALAWLADRFAGPA